ncbi:hypothetical protein VHEMI00902 [[Torrubiella] hemipterigena]|uniref:YCII-related domain-containing protein n=1 Tax=[Torrubiella] hemipterigena TaxID=1531966 RepID=A0A0A1T5X0_9HYPO|nr:hypothetical protein VHEMI00902 [[Torrubiella] hemipterigena]
MSSDAPRKFEFLCVVPDKPGAKAKRLEIRPKHLEGAVPRKESRTWNMGGAIFNSVPEGTDPTKFDFAGSAVVAVAETKEQVIEQLKEDIYYKEGVWDVDNAQIFPYLNAFRNP